LDRPINDSKTGRIKFGERNFALPNTILKLHVKMTTTLQIEISLLKSYPVFREREIPFSGVRKTIPLLPLQFELVCFLAKALLSFIVDF
jgi:hypothetical protein